MPPIYTIVRFYSFISVIEWIYVYLVLWNIIFKIKRVYYSYNKPVYYTYNILVLGKNIEKRNFAEISQREVEQLTEQKSVNSTKNSTEYTKSMSVLHLYQMESLVFPTNKDEIVSQSRVKVRTKQQYANFTESSTEYTKHLFIHFLDQKELPILPTNVQGRSR